MEKVTKEFLSGSWKHEEWSCELTMFNFLIIEWPMKIRGYGSWKLRGNEVILTYVQEGTRDRMFYIFSVEEILDDNTIKTKDVESNKIEILRRC
jgi:hypothetical protein